LNCVVILLYPNEANKSTSLVLSSKRKEWGGICSFRNLLLSNSHNLPCLRKLHSQRSLLSKTRSLKVLWIIQRLHITIRIRATSQWRLLISWMFFSIPSRCNLPSTHLIILLLITNTFPSTFVFFTIMSTATQFP